MVDNMHWGKCESCPPGKRYRYIPNSSEICLTCMEDKLEVIEHRPQHATYTQDELQEMRGE